MPVHRQMGSPSSRSIKTPVSRFSNCSVEKEVNIIPGDT